MQQHSSCGIKWQFLAGYIVSKKDACAYCRATVS